MYRKYLPRRLQQNPGRAELVEALNSENKVELALMSTFLRKIKDTAYDHYKEDMIPLIKKRKRRRSADTVSNNQIDLNTSYSHHSTVGGAHVVLEQSWSD